MFEHRWKVGDWVIYRLSKRGTSPGRRAHHVSASPKGESYNYLVDKFWVVQDITAQGDLVVRTPGGKVRTLRPDDPNLRPARWWHRMQWGSRFRTAEQQLQDDHTAEPA